MCAYTRIGIFMLIFFCSFLRKFVPCDRRCRLHVYTSHFRVHDSYRWSGVAAAVAWSSNERHCTTQNDATQLERWLGTLRLWDTDIVTLATSAESIIVTCKRSRSSLHSCSKKISSWMNRPKSSDISCKCNASHHVHTWEANSNISIAF